MSGSNKDGFNRKDFQQEVCHIVKAIPAGRVLTYGQVARLAGFPQHARQAGKALAQSSPSLPCHRVVNSQGRPASHWTEQRLLLEQEGVLFKPNGCVNLKKYAWNILNDD